MIPDAVVALPSDWLDVGAVMRVEQADAGSERVSIMMRLCACVCAKKNMHGFGTESEYT